MVFSPIAIRSLISFGFAALLSLQLTGFSQAQQIIGVPQPRPQPGAQTIQPVPGGIGAGSQPRQVIPPTPAAPAEPARIYQSACPAILKGQIEAKPLPPLVDGQCGERSPLAVRSLLLPNKISLSSSPQINCRTASTMVKWGVQLNQIAQTTFGSPVKTIVTGNGYQCRRRNNLPDGKISEHGFANALDILGFKLANGDDVMVERDWPQETGPTAKSTFLRQIHQTACASFTTVLGPEANQYHRDHFHFDLGCHGKSCTYLLCE